jgi:hypothetical protein
VCGGYYIIQLCTKNIKNVIVGSPEKELR